MIDEQVNASLELSLTLRSCFVFWEPSLQLIQELLEWGLQELEPQEWAHPQQQELPQGVLPKFGQLLELKLCRQEW